MSYNTSSTSFFNDSLSQSPRRRTVDTSDINNSSFVNDYDHSFNKSFNKLPNLSNYDLNIPSNITLKSLIESPFKSSTSSANKSFNSMGPSSIDAKTLLKLKIKEHERKFNENLKSNSNSNINIDNSMYLNSIFNHHQNRQTNTNLKNIGMMTKDMKISNNGVSNNNANNTSINYTTSQDLKNPYFIKALNRIVHKDLEFRKLLITLLFSFIYKFLKTILKLIIFKNSHLLKKMLVTLNQNNNVNNNSTNIGGFNFNSFVSFFNFENIMLVGSYVEYFITLIILILSMTSIYRLAKPQDKCLDLPLTKGQRKILGLEVEQVGEGEGETKGDGDHGYSYDNINARINSGNVEKPKLVVVPDNNQLDDILGSLSGLDIDRRINGNVNKLRFN